MATSLFLGLVLILGTACTNKKVSNPLINVDSKQPDKVLYDKAVSDIEHGRYEVARITLNTLIKIRCLGSLTRLRLRHQALKSTLYLCSFVRWQLFYRA